MKTRRQKLPVKKQVLSSFDKALLHLGQHFLPQQQSSISSHRKQS